MSTGLITGCSTGLGRSLAEAVLARGENVVVTGRDASRVQDLADAHPGSGIFVMAVEPGAFRTDVSGRSLTQSADPIADYADTAGKRRKENDSRHGTQPGDPAKAAQAVLVALAAPEVPALLVLGPDALDALRGVLDAQRAELDSWRELSVSTDLDA